FSITTPLGKAFVTINENGGYQPFEIFINSAKAGSDTAAVSEAIGRLLSYTLRLASSVEPRERMREIVRQLEGIGGGRSLGYGPNRVRSLPDGISQALAAYLTNAESRHRDDIVKGDNGYYLSQHEAALEDESAEQPVEVFRIGDLCPDCGQASFVNEEGCKKCYSCGFSEC
ncbi:MAG: ribonucleoside-diphosphate reductase, adenosylcobalamin-dependent, partial [Chloroflexi bacterium]|nr:ribonucleoside-diphosphate reductase, adenosylcobalamin-dependent [Chloroflexota bacterium]